MVDHSLAGIPRARLLRELGWPLVPIALSVFCLSGLGYYHIQMSGSAPASGVLQAIVVALYQSLGFVPAFMCFLLVLAWASIWFITAQRDRVGVRLLRIGALTVALAILVNLGPQGAGGPQGTAQNPEGWLGFFLAVRIQSVLGYPFSTLLISIVAVASLLLATDFFFYRYFVAMSQQGLAQGARIEEVGVEAEAAQELKNLSVEPAVEPSRRAGGPLPRVSIESPGLSSQVVVPPRASAEEDLEGSESEQDALECELEAAEEFEEGEEESEEAEEEFEEGEEEAEEGEEEEAEEGEEEEAEEEFEEGEEESEEEEEEAEEFEEGEEEAELQAEEEVEDTEEYEPEPEVYREPGYAIPQPEEGTRQGQLFGAGATLEDAADLVIRANRASVTFLRRRLRLSTEEARALIEELRDRGVVDGEAGEERGRVLLDLGMWQARSPAEPRVP